MKILALIILILTFGSSFGQIPGNFEVPADTVFVQGKAFTPFNLPAGYHFDKELGLMLSNNILGQVVHRNFTGGLYETRAIKTPGGDYLLMFPDGGHYGVAGKTGKKVNNMLSYRSKDQGKTWQGPGIAFDIDYNPQGITEGKFKIT